MALTTGVLAQLASEAMASADRVGAANVDEARRQWVDQGPSEWVDGKLRVMSARAYAAAYESDGERGVRSAVAEFRASLKVQR